MPATGHHASAALNTGHTSERCWLSINRSGRWLRLVVVAGPRGVTPAGEAVGTDCPQPRRSGSRLVRSSGSRRRDPQHQRVPRGRRAIRGRAGPPFAPWLAPAAAARPLLPRAPPRGSASRLRVVARSSILARVDPVNARQPFRPERVALSERCAVVDGVGDGDARADGIARSEQRSEVGLERDP